MKRRLSVKSVHGVMSNKCVLEGGKLELPEEERYGRKVRAIARSTIVSRSFRWRRKR